MAAIRCSSSLRTAPVAETLARARALAPTLGITRVTDITRLDRVGVPVFVSIRPDAERHSVCVSAGKGLRPEEAEAGAYMEAIELSWAEHRRARRNVELVSASARALGTPERPFAVLDHCPLWGRVIDLDAPMWCVRAEALDGGPARLVPAESVLHPLPPELGGARYFGTHSNGLASGNSVDEASVHGLCEVLERDVTSFHELLDDSRVVRPETLPEAVRAIAAQLSRIGFELIVRYLPNPFGLPAFTAVVFDRAQPELTSPGDGLHLVRDIALMRAVCETAQARLGFIHGGRDDLQDVYQRYAGLAPGEKAELFERELDKMRRGPTVDYAEVPDRVDDASDVSTALRALTTTATAAGLSGVLRVVYTPSDYPVHVVRVLVPGLELSSKDTLRMGPRLLGAVRG